MSRLAWGRGPKPNLSDTNGASLAKPADTCESPLTSIVVEQATDAALARVWRACSEPQGLRSWQADEVEGEVTPGAPLMLRWPALGAAIELRVERVEPMKRLVFRSDDAQLELTFAPGRVSLCHSAAFEDDDEREGTLSSWRVALATLVHYVEQHDGRPRQVHWAIERSRASVADAHAFFTLSGAQHGWLTRTSSGTGIGEVSSEVALELFWGSPLTGRVLAHTPPRDALISWRETQQSLLALRTLPCPGTSLERLLVATWSTWGVQESSHVAAHLEAALKRLARLHAHRAEA